MLNSFSVYLTVPLLTVSSFLMLVVYASFYLSPRLFGVTHRSGSTTPPFSPRFPSPSHSAIYTPTLPPAPLSEMWTLLPLSSLPRFYPATFALCVPTSHSLSESTANVCLQFAELPTYLFPSSFVRS